MQANDMSFTGKNDGELLAAFVETGQGAPFEEIVRRYNRLVFGVCLRVLRRTHDAEDATQAVFLTLVRKAGSLLGRPSVADWLRHVAYNVSLHLTRTVSREKRHVRESGKMRPASGRAGGECGEIEPLLDQALEALPSKYRVPLVLHYLQRRTEGDIARELGCKEGTLSMWLHRGREMLRSRLARRGVVVTSAVLGAFLVENAAAAAASSAAVASTVKAAVLLAAGKGAVGSVVSAHVSALVDGGLRAMFYAKVKVAAAVVAAAVTMGVGLAVAVDPPDQETRAVAPVRKDALSPATFDKLHTLIKPDPKKAFESIPWVATLWEARKKAAAEDKPMILWVGDPHPLGVT